MSNSNSIPASLLQRLIAGPTIQSTTTSQSPKVKEKQDPAGGGKTTHHLSIVQTTAFLSVTYNVIQFQQPFCGRQPIFSGV